MVYNSEVFWYLSPSTIFFSIFAIHTMTFHLLVHSNSTCFFTTVGWSVPLSTRRRLLNKVDHRHWSKLRVSHVLLKVYQPILCKNPEYHSQYPILLPEPFFLVDCPGLPIHFYHLVFSYHQELIILLLFCWW